jgi:hypothetical protein
MAPGRVLRCKQTGQIVQGLDRFCWEGVLGISGYYSGVKEDTVDHCQKGSVNRGRGNGNGNGLVQHDGNGLVQHNDRCPLDGQRNTLVASEVSGVLDSLASRSSTCIIKHVSNEEM